RLCGGGDGTGPPGLRTRLQVPDLASARQVTVHRRHGDRKLLRYLGGRVTAIDGSHDPRPEFHRIRSHRSLHAAAVLRLFIPPLAILLQTALVRSLVPAGSAAAAPAPEPDERAARG